MRFRHCAGMVCLPLLLSSSDLVNGAGTPCVSSAIIEKAALSPASAKHFYMECTVVTDGNHPFLARLTGDRRAKVAERLKDKTVQTLACSANPRDPGRT